MNQRGKSTHKREREERIQVKGKQGADEVLEPFKVHEKDRKRRGMKEPKLLKDGERERE